ncbi:amphoterin-induced protein 1-like isoform X2 [Haliotis rubra]|uniref:amphoterin-induced protein 1-like isoform X2 n=1 Tax=Haliotis rubra TaxID=36100 RepID=UPI001EE62A60|nr:amphoterin-induced protein 1-like isoform X2 [Haliotis rubra]
MQGNQSSIPRQPTRAMAIVLLGVLSLALLSIYPARGCSQSPDHLHSGTRVNCSYCNLTKVPNYLPGNTTILDISHNNISILDKTSLLLPHLRYLDASFSNISKLSVDAFHETTSLRVLLMVGNKLNYTDYPDEVFLPLQRLQKIHLHNNDGQRQGTYPKAFGKLRSIQEISLDTFEVTTFDKLFANMTNLTTLLLGFRVVN